MWRAIVVSVAVVAWMGGLARAQTKAVCEVVVVGTQHFISDMPEGYTPGHLRALLVKIGADVAAVEAPANVGAPWEYAPYEAFQVTRPFAEEKGWKVVPVGWNDDEYGQAIGAMIGGFQSAGKGAEYQKVEQAFGKKANRVAMGRCEGMNSEESLRMWRDYHAALHRMNGGETAWEALNEKIIENVKKVCAENAGKRVAVVFGSAHAYYLKDHLAKVDGVKVVEVGKYFPLTVKEIEAQTRPVDYVKALRLLNFESLAPGARAKLLGILKKVETYREFANDYHYFRGKYLLLTGAFAEAVDEFEMAGKAGEEAVMAFDGKARIGEVARLHAAVARYHSGKKEEGKAGVEAVVKDSKTTEGTKTWGRQLLSQM